MTVIVKQTLLLLQVEADPVMEAGDLAFLHFACNEESEVGGWSGFPSSTVLSTAPHQASLLHPGSDF